MCAPAKRILIVEDDSTLAGLLAYNLRRAGYEVVRESNGRDGLETAMCRMLDLVLMDLMLPRLDGMAAIKVGNVRTPTSSGVHSVTPRRAS